MKLIKFTATILVTISLVISLSAKIDVALQMQLGNPSNALTDTTNHDHYLIQRAQYAMDYNDVRGEPNWVSWDLTTEDVGSSGRSNFVPDTTLPAGFYQVQTTDYSGSGYDRGHMCPSADRTVTTADNQVLFYMSNMIPQAPDNNQGVWAVFEGYCRTLAGAGNELLITCGPSGFGGSRLPSGAAAIPGYTWKIVLVVPVGFGLAVDRIDTNTRVIAIKIPNTAGVRSAPWQNYITTVAQIEADTGFSFFTSLPASLASVLKTKLDGQSSAGAPVITAPPITQTTVIGGSATFSVTAVGDAPLHYQWFKDDVLIEGETNSLLTLDNVQTFDVGSYDVVISNAVGATTSTSAQLIITGLPPVVSASPVSQTVNAGNNVTLSVTVSGSPTLSYQWRKEGVPISTATTATLMLSNVQAADNGSYDVVVANSVSSTTSDAAFLIVNPSVPTVTGQPVTLTTTTGGSASFTVTASGTAPLSYQWRKAGVALINAGGIAGVDTRTLSLTGVSAINAGIYDVMVTNVLGFATSNPAALTITSPPPSTVNWDFGPSGGATANPSSGLTADITGGTVTQGNNNGATALLTTVSASSGYTGSSGTNNAGAAARTGTLNKASGGSAYFEFTLAPAAGKRLAATGISFGLRSTGTGPQAFSVFTSLDGFSTVVAVGTVPNDSNWHLHAPAFAELLGAANQAITFRIYGHNGVGSPGANTANWRLDDLKLSVSAIYPPPVAPAVVSISPADGANNIAVTSPITITFNEAVSFTGSWFSITSATNGTMAAAVTGGPTTYTLTPPIVFANTDIITVTIFGAQVVDQATGTIHGTADTTFTFDTADYIPPSPAVVMTQPVSQSVNAGSNVALSIAASGTAPFNYQWRKNGTAIIGNSSAATATLTLSNVMPVDNGSYDCVVSNIAGSDISQAAVLTVTLVPPSIINQPMVQMVVVGGNVVFNVTAAGTAPLSYQWRKNGVALANSSVITGVDQPTLALTGVSAVDSGSYDVVVSNAANSATSKAAALVVSASIPDVIYWDFTTANPTSGIPAGVTGGTLTQGNNNGLTTLLTAVSASSGYTGSSGTNNAGAAARVGALNQAPSGSAYFEFTFAPSVGKQFATTSISFGSRSTGTGPQAYAVFTSKDGFAAPVATGALLNNSSWRLITPDFSGVTGGVGEAVTFRIYGYNGSGGASANTANWRIDDLKLTAGVLAIPAIVPVITEVTPAAGSTQVSLSSPIAITFNQPVNVTGSWFILSSATQGALEATVSGGPSAFVLTPTTAFAYGDTITVTVIGNQVTEQATGMLSLSDNYSFAFTTIPPVPPSIVMQPQAITVNAFQNASFTVAASGTAPLSYQWRRNGAPISDNGSAATATLELNNVTTFGTGDYDCVISNLAGTATSDVAALLVNKLSASVTLGNLTATYDGAVKPVSVTTAPMRLTTVITYDGNFPAPSNAGSYVVVVTVVDPNYNGSATGTLVIAKNTASVLLSNLKLHYDGTPKTVTATTEPTGLVVNLTYNGNAAAPIVPGTYEVVATIDDLNYEGSASAVLSVTSTALVRHGFSLNGDIDGSVQVLSGENMVLNSNAGVFGDILVPGTPTVQLKGQPTFGGVIDGSGEVSPSNYRVTMNSGAVLRNLVRRVNSIAMPTVSTPPAPVGTRSVSINHPGQTAGDFSTLRNLTLSSSAGLIAVPPGNYGNLIANGSGGFILGLSGAEEPAVYNLQNLTLNGSSQIQVVGPVILTLAKGTSLNGSVFGNADHLEWLILQVYSGGLVLNGSVCFDGNVVAPNGTITINGNSTLTGEVICDRLVINGQGLLREPSE